MIGSFDSLSICVFIINDTCFTFQGYDDIVALLLRAGAPVNCRVTEDSSTPLHKACAGSKPGHLVAVQLLLDGGADVHALNKWRETPLLTAANHGQAGAVEALLKSGADPCKCTDTGWSPLSIAAYKGHDDVVRLLLEEGAPTEEADPTLSALLQAATKGLPGTVELLLRHGADHTVTTKKGDTALSILVEQNLIDAAVEMVTEYKASVPRCSRDRKKVQRARLLINLRVKQQQREGTLSVDDDDDDETDQEDSSDEAKLAQHDESNGGSPEASDDAATSESRKKKGKKKGGNNKMSAEQQAKAAEEALLLELEQEDAKARKEELDANKKSAKKKKKKEQQRQQKLKEEQKRREKEEQEMREKERIQKEKEEKLRKEREEKAKIQREKELKEAAEREKAAAARRKEREEKERRQQEKLQQQQRQEKKAAAAAPSPTNVVPSSAAAASQEKRVKQTKPKAGKKQPQAQPQVPGSTGRSVPENVAPRPTTFNGAVSAPTPAAPAIPPASTAPMAPSKSQGAGQTKNRGWETKQSPIVAGASEMRQTPPTGPPDGLQLNTAPPANPIGRQASSPASNLHTPTRNKPVGATSTSSVDSGVVDFLGFETNRPHPNVSDNPFASAPIGQIPGMLTPQQQKNAPEASSFAPLSDPGKMKNGLAPRRIPVNVMELPAVAVYRREKVRELLQRCALARSQVPSSDPLGVVDEDTVKRVLYRWMVRAAHEQQTFLDFIIPSWIDFELLTTFFQRQFIAESRKGMKPSARGAAMVSMESLKEAGSAMAVLCQALSKDVDEYRRRIAEQFPPDWSDMNVRMIASDVMKNGGGSMILIDWANRSQVYLPASTFTKLRDRYVGPQERLMSSLFVAKVRYETTRLIVADTVMDFRLLRNTQSCLAMEAGVNAEFWSDPFSALGTSIFSGQFPDVDALFGGLNPFGKEDGVEDFLSRYGGSVSLMVPLDNLVASRYLHRIVDLLESCDGDRIPLSFAVFLRSECFHDHNEAPSAHDLHFLDARLRDLARLYLRQAISLPAGQHSFQVGEGSEATEISWTGSLFVLLQNKAGAARFDVKDSGIEKILHSMASNNGQHQDDRHVLTPISSFPGSFGAPTEVPNSHPPAGYFVDNMAPISPMHPQAMAAADFGPIGGTAISKSFASPATNPVQTGGGRRPGGHRGRLFDLVDDGEEDNLNDVDVVSGMLNNLDLYNIPQSDVDIEAISLMGIGGPPPGGGLPHGRTRGRFG